MLQVISSDEGKKFLKEVADSEMVDFISDKFGISGVCNVIGSIKMAKHYKFKSDENIFVICTDGFDRYGSVMKQMEESYGKVDRAEAKARLERIFIHQEPSMIFEGGKNNRERWHNLKYFTWVEQQGMTIDELNAQKDQKYWKEQAEKAVQMNEKIKDYRQSNWSEIRKIMGV